MLRPGKISIKVKPKSIKGRLDKLLYVPLPTDDDRISIIKALTRKVPIAPDIDLVEIARDKRCQVIKYEI